jgi:hypothetical protein
MRSCEFKELTKVPTVATYTAEGNVYTATPAGAGGGEPQRLELPEPGLFSTVSTAADFLALQAAGLKPGETRALKTVGFGFAQPAWKLTVTDMDLTRHDDVEIDHAGAKVTARRYTSLIKTPMGVFKGETFTDPQGVPVKSSLVMPFGTVTMERK